MSARTEYDPAVERIIETINRMDVEGVANVSETRGRTTIDFSLAPAGSHPEESTVLGRAYSGEFGSGIVVDTVNGEVMTATLRYGDLGLPEGADLNIAVTEVQKRLEESNPPGSISSVKADAPFYVRFRQMSTMSGPGLTREGDDILHIEVNDRVPVDEFVAWLPRFTERYRGDVEDIREFTMELTPDG